MPWVHPGVVFGVCSEERGDLDAGDELTENEVAYLCIFFVYLCKRGRTPASRVFDLDGRTDEIPEAQRDTGARVELIGLEPG